MKGLKYCTTARICIVLSYNPSMLPTAVGQFEPRFTFTFGANETKISILIFIQPPGSNPQAQIFQLRNKQIHLFPLS